MTEFLRKKLNRLASALVFELFKVEHVHVREAMVGHLRHIDKDLAGRVAKGLALEKMPDAPKAAAPVQELEPSPALQLIGKMKDTLRGRTILCAALIIGLTSYMSPVFAALVTGLALAFVGVVLALSGYRQLKK